MPLDAKSWIQIQIAGEPYTLVSEASLNSSARLKLSYRVPFEKAIVLGNINNLIDEIGTVLNIGSQFNTDNWNSCIEQAKKIPGLGAYFKEALNTGVRITDIVLDVEAPTNSIPSGGLPTLKNGTVMLGFAFDFRDLKKNEFLGITLEAVGILLSFKYGS